MKMFSTRVANGWLGVWPVALLAVVGLALAPECRAGTPPRELIGTWDVQKVAVDQADQPHWEYVPDDPQLKYRELVIDEATAAFNDGSDTCKQAAWSAESRVKLGRWLGDTYVRPANQGAESPTLRDFRLSIPNQPVQPMHVTCAVARPGARQQDPWAGATFLLIPPDRLLMTYGNPALLVLKKRNMSSDVTPSFDCKRAATPSETAICQTPGLAGYDRSVADAYRTILKAWPAQNAAAKHEQSIWLERRNACGGDHGCLADTMAKRISDLTQETKSGVVGE